MDISHVHDSLVKDPTKIFVQTVEGDLIEMFDETSINRNVYNGIHVYPGSFNPIHDGHRDIYNSMPKGIRYFETSITRWQKEPLSREELEQRLVQFIGYAPVLITNVARMVEKTSLITYHVHSVTFHVGIDTLVRMTQDYGVIGIAGINAKFIVYDRLVNDKVETLVNQFNRNIPVMHNCSSGPKRSIDIMKLSSTAIRNALNKG